MAYRAKRLFLVKPTCFHASNESPIPHTSTVDCLFNTNVLRCPKRIHITRVPHDSALTSAVRLVGKMTAETTGKESDIQNSTGDGLTFIYIKRNR